SATDPAGLPLTIEYSSENLPETVQFTDYADGTGSFNWQTTADDAGSYTATFNLSNGEAAVDPIIVSITISEVIVEPPAWVSYPETEITVNAGEVVEFDLSATDPTGLPLTIEYSSENLPETVQFTDYADGTGSFNWQTTTDDAGSYTANFALSNGEHVIPADVNIVVLEVVQEPEWIELADSYDTDEGILLEFTIIGKGADPAQTYIEYSSNNIPQSVIFTDYGEGTAAFSWQPTSLDAGDYTAAFTLICGDKSIRKEVAIKVNDVDQPPEWIEIPIDKTAEAGDLIEISVMGVDYDADPLTIDFIPDNLPEAATFNDNGDGTGTLSWQTNVEDAGFYTATFKLISNELSSERTIAITVTEVAQPQNEEEPEGE
ncbi:hypothetical protein K9N50_04235, partial [bacterium]|nr:hypothetical protein [bacterium]